MILFWDLRTLLSDTVDGSEILLNQLRLVVYPIIYRVLYTSQVVFAGFLSTNSTRLSLLGPFCRVFLRGGLCIAMSMGSHVERPMMKSLESLDC